VLSDVEGMSYQDVAKILGVPRRHREVAPVPGPPAAAEAAVRLCGHERLYQEERRMKCRECLEHLYEFLDREITPQLEQEVRDTSRAASRAPAPPNSRHSTSSSSKPAAARRAHRPADHQLPAVGQTSSRQRLTSAEQLVQILVQSGGAPCPRQRAWTNLR